MCRARRKSSKAALWLHCRCSCHVLATGRALELRTGVQGAACWLHPQRALCQTRRTHPTTAGSRRQKTPLAVCPSFWQRGASAQDQKH
uniref:Putative secreted protein n=1 Tax=Ixodes ricinus TaxID=34613 RepID=A0A6B0U2H0_IXORI